MLVNGSVGKVVGYMPAKEAQKLPMTYIGVPWGLRELTRKPFKTAASREKARQQYDKWVHDPEEKIWPLVRFYKGRSRDETVDILCVPQTFVAVTARGRVRGFREQVCSSSNFASCPQAKPSQVPIVLAYALTVHKSQGQTLERVRVDLNRVWERGQSTSGFYSSSQPIASTVSSVRCTLTSSQHAYA